MKNIEIINASAGTGKTFNLTQRVLEKIKAGLPPENLMATTFTVKAADELRERIRLKLLKEGRTDDAQRILDGFIGTVNSVCARLLSEYAIDAGLSPALDVLPEEDGKRLFQIAVSSVIEKHADKLEPLAVSMERLGGGNAYQKIGDWRDDVRRVVDLARANQVTQLDLKNCADKSWKSLSNLLGAPSKRDLGEELERAIKIAIADLGKLTLTTKVSKEAFDALKTLDREIRSDYPLKWSDWSKLSKLSTGKTDAGGALDDLNEIAGLVLVHPGFHDDMKTMIYGVFECAGEALEAYDRFKRVQGLMDFVDQETKVLELLRSNKAFRESLKERLKQLMVDEFQDTSPIQLALFLEFNEIAGKSSWVGDPKQSIYGFRGTDSQLMDEVAKLITDTKTLKHSWRSKENLIEFTNAVFSEVFHWLEKDKVCLEIPAQRKKKAEGGWIETWSLEAKNNVQEPIAIANGVRDLLSRRPDIKASDIAILCRKNEECSDIAKCLEKTGIRASAPQGKLLDVRECQLAMAALRYMNDENDTVALAEIVHISPLHSSNSKWLDCLVKDKDAAIKDWKSDSLIAALDSMRKRMKNWTPLESLENAITAVELPRTLKSWDNLNARLCNLDALRGFCCGYVDQCLARRNAATVAGFISYLDELDPKQAEGYGANTVNVLTYHSAKGLEWPVVILTSLDSSSRGGAFGIDVIPAPKFDPKNPLANRYIHFWPWPFGGQKKIPGLDENLEDLQENKDAKRKAILESQRLIYVGMTRARDGLALSLRRKESKKDGTVILNAGWIDELADSSGNPVLKLPTVVGKNSVKIGKASIDLETYQFDSEELLASPPEEDKYLADGAKKSVDYPPARISPSSANEKSPASRSYESKLLHDSKRSIKIKSKTDKTALGNAIHGFLAVDTIGMDRNRQLDIATGLLRRWNLEGAMLPEDMLVVVESLMAFIGQKYPGAKILREWPIALRNADNQLISGFVDMVLELPEAYVVIDHKGYSENDFVEHVKQFAPQLALYKEAIEKATGKKVLATLIHLSLLGKICEVF